MDCGLLSAREKVLGNFVGFLGRVRKSTSWEVRRVAEIVTRDAGSITGRNISKMRKEFGKDPRVWSSQAYVRNISKERVPEGQEWVGELLVELLTEKQELVKEEEVGEDIELLNFYIETMATI